MERTSTPRPRPAGGAKDRGTERRDLSPQVFPLLGIPIGVGLGVMDAVLILILPDETEVNPFEAEKRFGHEVMENARRRDKGYEVLKE